MGFDVSAEPFVIQADDLSGVPLGTAGRGRLRIYTQRPHESGFAVVDATHQPAEPRIRDHVHSRHDETFIILDGSYRIRLGDHLVTAQRGEVVFVPRGTAHTFRNVSSGPGRLLNIISPADGVELLRDLAELMPTKPTDEAVAEVHERYGAALVAPLPGQAI